MFRNKHPWIDKTMHLSEIVQQVKSETDVQVSGWVNSFNNFAANKVAVCSLMLTF